MLIKERKIKYQNYFKKIRLLTFFNKLKNLFLSQFAIKRICKYHTIYNIKNILQLQQK